MSLVKINPTNWINSHIGTIYDIDGVAGIQCVDLYKIFLKDIGYPNPTRPIGGDGYADQIWYRRDALGLAPYFDYITGTLKEGDIVLWAKGAMECPSSHVAMFVKDDPSDPANRGIFLGSNQGTAHSTGVLTSISCSGALGALRYKGFTTNPTPVDTNGKLIEENGAMKITVDEINARANGPTGNIVRQYKMGDIVKYQYKYVGNGHRYIVWNEGPNKIYLAISGAETYGVEKWAEPVDIDESKDIIKDLIQEDGKATFTVDDVRERKGGPKGEVVRTFKTGDSVIYQYKYIGNGHRYVVRKQGNDYFFIAVSGSEEYGKDKWADCGPVEAVKPSEPEKPADPKPEEPKLDKNVKAWGCDISEHNPNFDVKGQGFVIIRATFGTNMDKLFTENVKKCQEAGVPFGVYCYSYALDNEQALEEAQYILEAIKDIDVPLGVWYDMEDADKYKENRGALTKENCTKFCEIFCDYVKSKGYYTGIYSSTWWFANLVLCGDKYPKWNADWGSNNGTLQKDFYGKCVLYQYTAIPYDKNVCYVDFSEMASHPVREPEQPKPEIPQFPDQETVDKLIDEQTKFYKNWNQLFDKMFG